MKSIIDVGVLGTGVWDGPPIHNDQLGISVPDTVRDPYRGRRDSSGVVRIAGMELSAERYPRTLASIEKAFADPYRGTVRRRFFPPDLEVSAAEADAAKAALDDAGLAPEDIDIIMVQSFLPDEIQPKNPAKVAHRLGMTRVMALGVDTVCNTPIAQLHVGGSLIVAGQAKHVLCVTSCAYSRVTDPGVSSTVQEADLAAAFVLGPRKGTRMDFAWHTDGSLHAAIKLGWDQPSGASKRAWWQGSQERLMIRFNNELQETVMGHIDQNARSVCSEVLRYSDFDLADVDLFLSHQPMSWFRDFISDVLNLPDGVAFDTFEEYANVNSASIAASMHEARRLGRIKDGSNVLIFAPAAGYVFGAVALRWS